MNHYVCFKSSQGRWNWVSLISCPVVSKGSHLVSLQSRSPNRHQQFPDTSFRKNTLSTSDSMFPYWGLLWAERCAFDQGSVRYISVWQIDGVQEKGRHWWRGRDRGRERNWGFVELRLQTKLVEQEARLLFPSSSTSFLIETAINQLKNQLRNANNNSGFYSPDHFFVDCWVFQAAKSLQAIPSWTNSSPIAWKLGALELSVSSGSSNGGISFKMLLIGWF